MASVEPIKVVVVGGAFAGVNVVKGLLNALKTCKQDIEITLIERRDARHHTIGAYRALVDPAFSEQVWVPYTHFLPKDSKHRIVRGWVSEVHLNHVVLSSGETIAFDYLALCTGSMNASPSKFNVDTAAEAIAISRKIGEDIRKASSIVVVGGGACGVELSGEIKSAYPDKTVTLVHSGSSLVDYKGFAPGFKTATLKHLESKKIQVILNENITIEGLDYEHAVQIAPRTIHTQGGKTIESDLQILTVGMKVNTSYLATLKPAGQESFDSKSLVHADTNLIKTKKTLQLDQEGLEHIFAVGDCADFEEVPTAAAAMFSGPAVSKNIIALINAKESKTKPTLANGSQTPKAMVLATGPTTGVSILPLFGTRFGNFFAKLLKCKDLMLQYTTKDLNIPTK